MHFLIIISLTLFANLCQAKETITWIAENFEPFYIQSGHMAGKGITDRLNEQIIKELPEYDHVFKYMPILRITNALQQGEHIVVNSYLKNPGDQSFATYSITTTVVPPLELTLRKQDWSEKWGKKKALSLKEFFQKKQVLGIAGRRYYGDILTPVLSDRQNTYILQSSHYRSLADMVAHHRIDATIGYAAELKYYENFNTTKVDLVSIPIAENQGFLYAYIVLPKNPPD